MKIKAIARAPPPSGGGRAPVPRIHRNLDPTAHPLSRAREYQRAVTAVKLDRMFAKPFVGAMEGHSDCVSSTAQSRRGLLPLVTGGYDGRIMVWDLAARKSVMRIGGGGAGGPDQAHAGPVTGVVVSPEKHGTIFYSCGDDKRIHRWKLGVTHSGGGAPVGGADGGCDPEETWTHSSPLKSMDHHWSRPEFATAGDGALEIWSPERSAPVQSHTPWGSAGEGVTCCRYNPSETSLVGHCSTDRGVGLTDTRAAGGVRKTVLAMRSNAFEWNPMEPMTFTVGNEDHNCYTFDVRRMDRPSMIHRGHVGAVLALGYGPTGKEFATGGYDKTVRIFGTRSPTARDCYHTRRMQRVFAVDYTADSKYIITGSDDHVVRIWRSRASEGEGQRSAREERSLEYRAALVKKFEDTPEVRRISKGRRLPKLVRKQTEIVHVQRKGAKRKMDNVVRHSGKDAQGRPVKKYEGDRKKAIVKEID